MRLTAPIHVLKRNARLTSRETGIPLHAALDRIARDEGLRSWSHLSSQVPPSLLSRMAPGDLVLLAARPGHGKTSLGLELAAEAAEKGRAAFVFTLDYTDRDVRRVFERLNLTAEAITVDTSDAISADYIVDRVGATENAFVVIDYLQLLDQKRSHPDLQTQVDALGAFARSRGAVIVAISQVDRSFDLSGRDMPAVADIRLPNPLDLSVFGKRCFLHDGAIRFETARA